MAPLSASALVGTTSLANLSSARHRPPSLAPPREEGWTEAWGGKDCKATGDGDGNDGDGAGAAVLERPYLPPRYVTVLKEGCDDIGAGSRGRENKDAPLAPALTLTQHRVAWFEQIVLRMCFIPHVVENSGYAAMESTGGLPYLLDMNDGKIDGEEKGAQDDAPGNTWAKSLSRLEQPVLIGRNQPGGMGSQFFHQCNEEGGPARLLPSGSHIVDYLRLKHSHRMSKRLLFPEHLKGGKHFGDALAYQTLIEEKLNYILMALRYGNDPAWYGVYKPQCVNATLDPKGERAAANGGTRRHAFFPLWAWYQVYAERTLALHNLLPSAHATPFSTRGGLTLELFRFNDHRQSAEKKSQETVQGSDEEKDEEGAVHQHHPMSSFFPSRAGGGGGDTGRVNVSRAMELADVYASLEERLASSSDAKDESALMYFLGTEKPTYIDAMLFTHIAEALCDVHLVLVLTKHSRLVKYFQRMYDQYFGDEYATGCRSNRPEQESDTSANSWVKKNNVANALNAFNQIPETTSLKPKAKDPASIYDEGQEMVHAIQVMQQMAVHCHELDEALLDAAVLRMAEGAEGAVSESYHRPVGSRLYRWIMGGDITFWGSGQRKADDGDEDVLKRDDGDDDSHDEREKERTTEEDNKQRMYQEHMKRMKRDRRTNDELWLSGVVVTVVAALIVSAYGSSKR